MGAVVVLCNGLITAIKSWLRCTTRQGDYERVDMRVISSIYFGSINRNSRNWIETANSVATAKPSRQRKQPSAKTPTPAQIRSQKRQQSKEQTERMAEAAYLKAYRHTQVALARRSRLHIAMQASRCNRCSSSPRRHSSNSRSPKHPRHQVGNRSSRQACSEGISKNARGKK